MESAIDLEQPSVSVEQSSVANFEFTWADTTQALGVEGKCWWQNSMEVALEEHCKCRFTIQLIQIDQVWITGYLIWNKRLEIESSVMKNHQSLRCEFTWIDIAFLGVKGHNLADSDPSS